MGDEQGESKQEQPQKRGPSSTKLTPNPHPLINQTPKGAPPKFFLTSLRMRHPPVQHWNRDGGSVLFREEDFKTWDSIVTDKLIYGAEAIQSKLENR